MVRSDLFKIPPLIRLGQEGFSGSFCNVTRCLTAHQWWREGRGRSRGSQQAVEGRPNVSCRAWLVNISGERCKRPLTQPRPRSPPGAALADEAGAAEWTSPKLPRTPTKKSFSFVIHMPLRAQRLPVDIHSSFSFVCGTYLAAELVGGWAWVNASLWGTSLHLWSEHFRTFHIRRTKVLPVSNRHFCFHVTLRGELHRVSLWWISHSSAATSPCAVFLRLSARVWWIRCCFPCDKPSAAARLRSAPHVEALVVCMATWCK